MNAELDKRRGGGGVSHELYDAALRKAEPQAQGSAEAINSADIASDDSRRPREKNYNLTKSTFPVTTPLPSRGCCRPLR